MLWHASATTMLLVIPVLTASAQVGPALQGTPASASPPVPALPLTLSRDDQGRATIRAVRVTTPMRTDGALDEGIYAALEPASGFIQMEPRSGEAATERTQVWFTYDAEHVYITFKVWESQPDRMIVNEMRRDSANIRQGDAIGFSLDTFRDRRSALQFEANALGAKTDGQSTNERQYNGDWNPIWSVAAGRFEGGWIV